MHIPDGFLDLKTCVTTYLLSGAALSYGIKKLKNNFSEKNIPILGILGAFIFAAQMINIPIGFGTSGHLMGGVLAMLVLGPWSASLIITSILVIQSVFFMDGGILALGANVLNMALIQVWVGYFIYNFLTKINFSDKLRIIITGLSAAVISAAFAAFELSFSNIVNLNLILGAMVGWHIIIGLMEGLITMLVLSYLKKTVSTQFELAYQKGGAKNA